MELWGVDSWGGLWRDRADRQMTWGQETNVGETEMGKDICP